MRDALETVLRSVTSPAVAVSGGVDSITLAAIGSTIHGDLEVMHAVSPAVPAEATARVRLLAAQRGWRLTLLEAGEFADPDYLANPVNRCFHCKRSLYGAIRARTSRPILSGANLDDLGEYRPGLEAARLHGVRHPYVEAGVTKAGVRELARQLQLHDVAELPASPCLSSRIETGIRIDADLLRFVHRIERDLTARLAPRTVRCRVRAGAVVIELDDAALARLGEADVRHVEALVGASPGLPGRLPIRFEGYRSGSAFLLAGS